MKSTDTVDGKAVFHRVKDIKTMNEFRNYEASEEELRLAEESMTEEQSMAPKASEDVQEAKKHISIYQFALGNCTLKEYMDASGDGKKEARRYKHQVLEHIKKCIPMAEATVEQIEKTGSKEEKALLQEIIQICQDAEKSEHCLEWSPPNEYVMSFLMNNVNFCDFVTGISKGKVRAKLDGLDGTYLIWIS